jgi:hypothetical protein
MAMLTPAQKPRGLASRIFIGAFYVDYLPTIMKPIGSEGMKTTAYFLVTLLLVGCGSKNESSNLTTNTVLKEPRTLPEARQGFVTKIVPGKTDREPAPNPPTKIFRKVKHESPVGQLAAYITPDPGDGKKHPAIIWITGGDCNSIGDVWSPAPAANDQTASAFRKAGIAMMFPSLRGGNDNPGRKEGFFGEVDDVLAAREFLEKQPFVDPKRIYLGGHSTGGTLALLVSECTDKFRAVFSFGPVHEVAGYPAEFLPVDRNNGKELDLRSPIFWLNGVKSPTYVIEGGRDGNLQSLYAMLKKNWGSKPSSPNGYTSINPNLFFFQIPSGNHFNIIQPTTKLLAKKILEDDGTKPNLGFTEFDVIANFNRS